MYDLKHLTVKKRFTLSRFFQKKKPGTAVNSFRAPAVIPSLEESEPKRRRLRMMLPLFAAALAAYPVFSLVTSTSSGSATTTKPLIVRDASASSQLRTAFIWCARCRSCASDR